MNALPPLQNLLKIAAFTALTATFTGMAFAADMAEATPQFSVQSNATRSIRSGASAFEQGNFAKSVVFSKRALKEGLKKSRKTVAYSNLCAGLGAQGAYDDAREACDSALKIAPQNWQAFSNRAVVNWLSGDKEQAAADFASAQKLASDAPAITHNAQIFG
ncbi:MAG: hypothetical protein COA69_12585 [Robiginitomaculum sp.]|nr:MAG: hypothetical protein COA69_12585 [Robiginitomaculum sp.]